MLSATHMLTKVDDNTISLQSKDRTINGVVQPEIPETTLKRQPAPTAKVGAAATTTR